MSLFSVFGTLIASGYVILVVSFLYEAIVFTIYYAEEHSTTSLEWRSLDDDIFANATVCSFSTLLFQKRDYQNTEYGLRFYMPELHKDALKRLSALHLPDLSIEDKFPGAGGKEPNSSDIKDILTSRLKIESTCNDNSYCEEELKFIGGPVDGDTRFGKQMVCVSVPAFAPNTSEPEKVAKFAVTSSKWSNLRFAFRTPANHYKKLADKKTRVTLLLGLYHGQYWFALQYVSLGKDAMEIPDGRDIQFSEFQAKMQLYKYLNKRRRPCISVPDGARYPVRFAETICKTQCQDEFFNRWLNCSWMRVFDTKPIDGVTYRFCNGIDVAADIRKHRKNLKKIYQSEWETCIKQRGCKDQTFCTEWNIDLKLVGTTFAKCNDAIKTCQYGYKTYEASIFFSNDVTAYVESRNVNIQQWFGNVGGLLGIFTGLSLASILECLGYGHKKFKQRNAVTGESSE